jgi:uncharacterized membrane protein
MASYERQSASAAYRRPLYPAPLAIAHGCFIGALLTDLTYWRTAEMMWTDFSAWLLFAGLVLGGLAVLALIFDLLTRRFAGPRTPSWPYLIGSLIVLVISLFNSLVHTRDAWTSVVPTGMTLSAAAVIVLILSRLAGWLARRPALEVVR